jgi:hypothetical protein
MAGQIADGEGVFVLPVDQLRRLAVVHGPHTPRTMPLQSISLLLMSAAPHRPVSVQEVRQDASPLFGEEIA